jgi:hydrogenase maturation protease
MNILILGVGNILLTDESVGVKVIEDLQRRYVIPPEVEIVDGGTAGMELLEIMANRDLVIITDAVRTGHAPGTRVRLAGEQVPAFFRTRISPHQLGISDVIATLMVMNELPKEIVILGVVPESLETGLELTPTVAEALPRMVQDVVEELQGHGITLAKAGSAA